GRSHRYRRHDLQPSHPLPGRRRRGRGDLVGGGADPRWLRRHRVRRSHRPRLLRGRRCLLERDRNRIRYLREFETGVLLSPLPPVRSRVPTDFPSSSSSSIAPFHLVRFVRQGSYDHFHFLHFNRTADVTVTALMGDFNGTDGWRKGGIMFRADTGQRSPHSMIQVTGYGVCHQGRNGFNHGSWSVHDLTYSEYEREHMWFRLVKENTTIASYIKRDGEHGWMKYHEVEQTNFGDQYQIGIAVSSHDMSQVATLQVTNFEISDVVYKQEYAEEVADIGATGNRIQVQERKPGVWDFAGAGSGIGGSSDSLAFRYVGANSDGTATMQLDKVVRRNGGTKGGLMMRANTNPNSTHVSLLVNSDDGVTLYYRDAEGGDTTSINKGVWHEDVVLKLVNAGGSVEASYKHSSATDWYVLGTAPVTLPASYLVGQAVSSNDYGDMVIMTAGTVDFVASV
ncbi:hypothetical protein ACHAWF_006332, partial [Thalassiosira exigua]